MIIKAAIRKKNKVYTGRSHADIILACMNAVDLTDMDSLDGFLTDKGVFLDRYEAAAYAYRMGQIKRPVARLQSFDINL